MATKDIGAQAPLERAIRDDPAALRDRIDEIRERLDCADPEARRDAARALRAAAAADPDLVAPYRDTVEALLTADDGSLRLSGAIAVAELAEADPDSVAGTAPALRALLAETVAPAVDAAAIRALAGIAAVDVEAVAAADPLIAERVRSATVHVRGAVVSVFAGVLTDAPARFPETVAAVEKAVTAESGALQRHAVLTVTGAARTDPTAVSSLERIERDVASVADRLRSDPRPVGGDVIEAAESLADLRANRGD